MLLFLNGGKWFLFPGSPLPGGTPSKGSLQRWRSGGYKAASAAGRTQKWCQNVMSWHHCPWHWGLQLHFWSAQSYSTNGMQLHQWCYIKWWSGSLEEKRKYMLSFFCTTPGGLWGTLSLCQLYRWGGIWVKMGRMDSKRGNRILEQTAAKGICPPPPHRVSFKSCGTQLETFLTGSQAHRQGLHKLLNINSICWEHWSACCTAAHCTHPRRMQWQPGPP